jgi:hypothetical protein
MYVPVTQHAQTPVAAPPGALVEMAGGTPFAEESRPLASATGGQATQATLKLGRAQLNVLAGHRGSVAGVLEPSLAGRMVVLQTLTPHGWRGIAQVRTAAGGRFRLRFLRGRPGSQLVRLRFAGDLFAHSASRMVGRLNVYRLAEATSSNTRSFVKCVTERESGMRWHIVDPPYSGGDQWTQAAWLAAGGGRFAPTAAEATPDQQIGVFLEYEPTHPGAWPVTVPACS